ncbi:DedA family protein [Roseospira marina]|uniref:DedA family protein n=1 Tax=Roseospira marina TaxID=140057 RepID=A0A5M6IDD9_9PROT|nr:VTT domain-containing protein [Roseospira marina]KAA5606304.1 DedA family protein [Roseospira marina]MBB4314465.1 membrane protein YqaA with SNARE-associated domain [Roseospira marina]MBB5087625.1 membrane protein YqaA with SNARE-associated domain [Roseospira marina]
MAEKPARTPSESTPERTADGPQSPSEHAPSEHTPSGDAPSEKRPPQRGRRARAAALLDRLKTSRRANALLFTASLLESIIVPIPIELVLIPYMMARPTRAWRIATVALAGCLVGAAVGYGVGQLVLETLGRSVMEWAGWTEAYATFHDVFSTYGFWAIVAVGVLPIPFQVAMLAAGAAGYPFLWFLVASALARGVRYHGLALLVRLYGRKALALWDRHRGVAMALAALILVALWGVTQLLARVIGTAP